MKNINIIKKEVMAAYASKLEAVNAEMSAIRAYRDKVIAATKVSCNNSLEPLIQQKKGIMQERNTAMQKALAIHAQERTAYMEAKKAERLAFKAAQKAEKLESYKSICNQLPSVAYPTDLRAVAESESISVNKVAAALKACGWHRKEQTFSVFSPEVGRISKTASVWTK